MNENGIQDEGETALAGLEVTLFNSIYGSETTTLTNSDGTYEFRGLDQGDYELRFGDPDQPFYSYPWPTPYFTQMDQGDDDSLDSDADGGGFAFVTLEQGSQTLSYVDVGLVPLASISGTVWSDSNDNGVRDGGESGMGGILVELEGFSGDRYFTLTNDDGTYEFTNLEPGQYDIVVDSSLTNGPMPPGEPRFVNPFQGDNDQRDSDVDPNLGYSIDPLYMMPGDHIQIDAGMREYPSVQGRVWDDLNMDGVQDMDEPGVAGVVVTLRSNYGGEDFTTLTASDGTYEFNDLSYDSYQLQVGNIDQPALFPFTIPDSSTDETTDSDVDGMGYAYLDLYPGSPSGLNDGVVTVDAGLVQPLPTSSLASLSGTLWHDRNDDGIQDPDEPGLAGLVLELRGGSVPTFAVTNADGFYQFVDLDAGEYAVQLGLEEFDPSADINQGSPFGMFSGSYQTSVTIPDTTSITDLDAGIILPPSIQGTVWHDANDNGIQDVGEEGIAGAWVELDDNGQTYRMVTNAAGMYEFQGLNWGTYDISIQPSPALPEFELALANAFDPDTGINDDSRDSDFESDFMSVTLMPDVDSELVLDAGVVLSPTVSGRVWHDWNQNGLQESHEPGIAGVKVELNGAVNRTAYTNAEGLYEFQNLYSGSYDLFIDGYMIAPDAQFTEPNAMIDTGMDYIEDDERDSDMESDRLFLDLYGGQQLDIDAGIVGYLGSLYPEFYFELPQASSLEGDIIVPVLDPIHQERCVTYTIDWGDGSEIITVDQDTVMSGGSPEMPFPEHIYDQAGSYTVKVTATDEEGDRVTQNRSIFIQSVLPEFEIDAPTSEREGFSIPLTLTSLYVPPVNQDGSVEGVMITINWGDGTSDLVDSFDAPVPEHVYEEGGQYTIEVTATDDDGETVTQTRQIFVEAIAPTFEFALPSQVEENAPVLLNLFPTFSPEPSPFKVKRIDS